jgi:hypothetical protein
MNQLEPRTATWDMKVPALRITGWDKVGVLVNMLIALALGFFHVVGTGHGITVVPKEHFTYSLTFISVEEVIKRHNSQSLGEALLQRDVLFENLERQLLADGYIGKRK